MNRKILDLAIPNILSNLTAPLLGLVDLALMGHLESDVYIGAVALGGMIFNFIFWGFGFLRMGTTGLTAQAFGENQNAECFHLLIRALIVALGGAFLLLSLQYPISLLSFYIIQGSPEVEALAQEYFYIRIYAAPASIGLYALTGWFLGMQNAKIPLLLAFVLNLCNIIANYIFVMYWGMGSAGVAWGTVLAQYVGLGVGVVAYLRQYNHLNRFFDWQAIGESKAIRRFFEVNQDILVRTLMLLFTFSFFYAESARFGDELLAVNSLLLQFNTLMAFGVDGFAFAAESLVGMYIGAQAYGQLRRVIRLIFYWGMGLACVFSVAYALGAEWVLSLLTNKSNLIRLSQDYLFWVILAPLVNAVCFIWDGIYIGATASKAMRNSIFIATFLVFLPIYYVSLAYLDNHALWLAMTAFMVVRGITLSLWAKKWIYSLA